MIERFYQDMDSATLAAAQGLEAALAILPIAAIEAHGPHLPLGTDSIIAEHMLARAAATLPADWPVTILPCLPVGLSPEHAAFAGTLSLSAETALALLSGLSQDLRRSGFRRLLFLSSHGGNMPVLDLAAMAARQEGMLATVANWQRFGLPAGLVPASESAYGIHGGAVETALMLAFRPDLVRRAAIAHFPSLQTTLEGEAELLRAHGRLGFAWAAQDLHPEGVVGDARLADAAMGEAIAAHQVAGLTALAGDLLAFDLARLRAGPPRP
ncbi:creatininase family protein [Aureimonas frigidaquae]|uniref:Putative creatinine amidohydrolase n=1 Tax=Aureimonas frigidaquae TaxID=424757 RepID=A0A0P0Z0G0_9HYPH|nr:creatininase family protein [Aureimonas frigidaquae]BAT27328.1 putative creatinine amidohydrolase [Aureimonas frigidaquae]